MESWNRAFITVATALEGLRSAAHSASGLEGVGAAVSSVRHDCEQLVVPLAADIAEAELLARVVQQYGDAFTSSAKRANDLIDDIEDAHADWSSKNTAATHAGNLALASSRVADTSADAAVDATAANADAREAIGARDTAKATLDNLWEEFDRYYTQWDEAYDAAIALLAGSTGAVLTSAAQSVFDAILAANGPDEILQLWMDHPELHDELRTSHPDIFGNLDGIPWDVRAEINKKRLEDSMATEQDESKLAELEAIWQAIEAGGSPRPNLISFDPDGSEQATAALAYGDLTSATEINTLVPGMNANVKDLASWGASARDLNNDVGVDNSATVVWFGYDTPGLTEEPGMGRAESGGAALAGYLTAVRALAPDADINVIAHSYGSTTAAYAIGSDPDGLGVDSLITVGSAGFPDDPAVQEGLAAGDPKIYSTISEDDWVARVGRGTSPSHPVSPETMPGVTVFGSDGGVGADGSSLPASTKHDALGPGAYLQPGSESFYNITEIIVTGEPGTQVNGPGSEQGFWDPNNWWISDEYAVIGP